jgi:hypothetical protein
VYDGSALAALLDDARYADTDAQQLPRAGVRI